MTNPLKRPGLVLLLQYVMLGLIIFGAWPLSTWRYCLVTFGALAYAWMERRWWQLYFVEKLRKKLAEARDV